MKLEAGEKDLAAEPIIDMPHDYLWIGNDADGDKRCYATLSNKKALRKLAHQILAKIGPVKTRKRSKAKA